MIRVDDIVVDGRKDMMKEVWLQTVITGTSATAVDCPFCGKVNYIPENGTAGAYVQEGYCEHAGEKVLRVGVLEGRTVVADCACGRLEVLGRWMWSEREIIIAFLSRMAEAQTRDAQDVAERTAGVKLKLVKP